MKTVYKDGIFRHVSDDAAQSLIAMGYKEQPSATPSAEQPSVEQPSVDAEVTHPPVEAETEQPKKARRARNA